MKGHSISDKMWKWLEEATILRGGHGSRAEGTCIMEAASYIAGYAHSANPRCVHDYITTWMIHRNDTLKTDEDRAKLKPLIPIILDTVGSIPTDYEKNSDAIMVAVKKALKERGWPGRTETLNRIMTEVPDDVFHDVIVAASRAAKGLPECEPQATGE